ncbi:hypothetical protein WJX84_001830 [Apatococcus fuscideae]|uniref:Protein CASP n=1 Tax=Apatococcus fuscideae TaxID=2026836 RepID=A0AAW1STG4_9CHLO
MQKATTHVAKIFADFKRRAPPDAVKEVGPLLKSYQEEIDKLTKRAKFGETAYLNVYQKQYEAPDPHLPSQMRWKVPHAWQSLRHRHGKMAQELAEYKSESTELRNQDHTVRRLEERVRSLEAELGEKGKQLEEARETALEESKERLLEEVQAREVSLTDALAESHAGLASMKRLHEASQRQLFAMQSRTEEEQAGLQSELELATAEIDRTAQRLMTLEREKERLKVNGMADGAAKQERSRAAEDSLRKSCMLRAQGELRAVQQDLEQERAGNTARMEGLKAALQAQEAQSAALDQELRTRPTSQMVDELRQQVADLTGELEVSTSKCSAVEGELSRQQQLVARLEEDLLAAEQRQSNPGEAISDAFDSLDSAGLLADGGDGGEHTMLSALCSQRDRFRERVQQVEEQLASAHQDHMQLKRDLDSARADNVALVERLRFVQGYQSQQRRRAGDVERGEVESRYSSAYEEKINPFADFRSKERESRRRQMHVADRLMYEFWQLISGDKWARIFVFAYTLLGHFLVFWVLARYSHQSSHVASQLAQAQAACQHLGANALNATSSTGKAALDLPIDASYTQGT